MTACAVAICVTVMACAATIVGLAHYGEPWGWGFLLLIALPSFKTEEGKP